MSTRGLRYAGCMRIDVITLFPQMFTGPLTESILGRAQEQGLLSLHFHDLRQFGIGNYHQIDDSPYGGGAGMVMRVDTVVKALEAVSGERSANSTKPHRIYFSPRGK